MLLEIDKLFTQYKESQGFFKRPRSKPILDGVSLSIAPGEVFGIAGESGCGKTTLLKAILGIVLIQQGDIIFEGQSIREGTPGASKALRQNIQMVFQNPYSSLNPRMTIFETLAEAINARQALSKQGIKNKVHELLKSVGLFPEAAQRYPHAFSGGQRQRIAIARALATEPKLLLADEPTAALDASSQSQILSLFKSLAQDRQLSILFVSHNLGTLSAISNRIGVLYLGQMVEMGPTRTVLHSPIHPYTKSLCESVLTLSTIRRSPSVVLEPLSPGLHCPVGCHFASRCCLAQPSCHTHKPILEKIEGRWVACPIVASGLKKNTAV
jgi:oligopeptide/dipeptide ABC transporter ATP-binding protein